MFTIPEKIVLADEEWLPLLQGQWVGSTPDMTFKVTDDVMQGQIGKLTQYGPVKFRVGYYEYNKTDIILIPERARDFDDYGGFAFPRIRDGASGTTGTRTDAPRFCRHCGSPAKPGDNFCRQCGGKLRV